MNLKFCSLALALAATLLLPACKDKEEQAAQDAKAAIAATGASPQAAVAVAAKSLRAGNLKAIVEASVPPQYLEQVRGKWLAKMHEEPITDVDRAEFKQNLERFTAADAEQKMWAEIEPQFTQKQAEIKMQMPMFIGIGRGVLASGVQQREELNEAQKQQALAAVDAFAKWAETANFTDPELAKKSIGIFCSSAREMNLQSLDEVRAMSFDQVLVKGDIAFAGVKKVFDLYGFSLDQVFDSVDTQLISQTADAAKVKVNFQMFGQPLDFETDMVKFDGRWYGKDALSKLQKEAADDKIAAAKVSQGNG
ncbi:MAG: hypothetical protein SGI99_15035 [Pseudomonadota bacterium]|nr:hypothetical protein [Pseudomonadota bacterium]